MYRLTLILALMFITGGVYADDLLYRFEGNVLPDDPSAGWLPGRCEGPCSTSLQDGHFILTWLNGSDQVNYTFIISNDFGVPPLPETLWVEWNFRSDQTKGPFFFTDDGAFVVRYSRLVNRVFMYGDTVISFEGSDAVFGLDISEFHTYRFESFDGLNYTFYVDGQEIFSSVGQGAEPGNAFLQLQGNGREDSNAVNEWDFVRYGTIGDGESIVSSDPPAGVINSDQHPEFDRFTITFDKPGYVFINDVTVTTSGTEIPVVLRTRRLDNGDPETVQIVLDRPLSVGETTTFTFDTGGTPSVVEYTYLQSGSCCLADGECLETTDVNCADLGGNFSPDGLCEPVQACCQSGACSMIDPVCCQFQSGTVKIDDVCDADPDGDGVDGVCGDRCPEDFRKLTPGQCGCGFIDNDFDLDTVANCLDQCPGEDDRIDKNRNRIPDCVEQQVVIPAVSDWGMVVLILVLLIAFFIKFDRRMHLN